MYCKNCGNKFDDDAIFCIKCGTQKDSTDKYLYCERCGTKISEDAAFCTECGTPIPEKILENIRLLGSISSFQKQPFLFQKMSLSGSPR